MGVVGRFREELLFYLKLVGAAVGVYLAFRFLLPLFAPFVIAYLLALLVRRPVRFLKRRCHVPCVISASVLLVLLIASLAVSVFFLSRLLFRQVGLLAENYDGLRASFFACAHRFCCMADEWFRLERGTAMGVFEGGLDFAGDFVRTRLMPHVPEASLMIFRNVLVFLAKGVFTFVAAILILMNDKTTECGEKKAKRSRKRSPEAQVTWVLPGVRHILSRLCDTGASFLKTQGILVSLVALVCTVGFLFVKPEYALLLGAGVAILDAFPILGSGMVLVPWAVVQLFLEQYWSAVILIVMYVCCLFIRQILEPKLLGSRIGLSAFMALVAVYVGVELFGIAGIVLGPFLFVIVQTIAEELSYEPKIENDE